jgi:hypothetical protein
VAPPIQYQGETRYFQTLNKKNGNIMTIAGSNAHIMGTRSATLVLLWVLKNMWWIYSLHRHREDRNALARSLWEITMSLWICMMRSPLTMWNQESHMIERPLLSTNISPQKIAGSMDLDLEPKSMVECWKHSNWDK